VIVGSTLPAARLTLEISLPRQSRSRRVGINRGSEEIPRILRRELSASVGQLDLVKLTPLMERTSGRADVKIGLIDGPVLIDHPDLAGASIREVPGPFHGACTHSTGGAACMHGTFVAGVLCAARGSSAPSVCPNCTLLVRSIFSEAATAASDMPTANPEELASAIVDTVDAGAWVINLSASLIRGSARGERAITHALDYAAVRGVITVAAAGNQNSLGGSAIVSHRWVIPVVGCDSGGQPLSGSNLVQSTGRRGLRAPGLDITSLSEGGGARTLSGTSAAAPFVTGAIALIWSQSPSTTAANMRFAVSGARVARRAVLPPLLDAWSAWMFVESTRRKS
jgi:subtilisin family serine protease